VRRSYTPRWCLRLSQVDTDYRDGMVAVMNLNP